MKVYSELGRDTTFKLLFPAASGVCEISPAATPSADVLWHGTGTVLVVDDEETMRSTVARMMRRLGMGPVLVCDGREAVEVFRAEPDRFALVLLDLTMPHMDGEQTFGELRRLRPDVRVVLMSGFNAQEAVVRFTGKGLASFLQKPFALAELRASCEACWADAGIVDYGGSRDMRDKWICTRHHGAGRYPCGMPLFLFEPDRKVSLRAFGALALTVLFYLTR